jgi:phospholipid transport system substrate-binding protein
MMIRRRFLCAALALGLAVAMSAQACAASAEEARAFVQDLAQKAIATVADKQLGDEPRNERFRQLFISAFDLPEIGRFVLSRYWRKATPEQQTEFVKLFEETNVLVWSKRFKDYDGERLETSGATKDGDSGWVVDSQILRPRGQPIPVQWRLDQSGDGRLHITDIVSEGVSMALTQRQDYSAAMQSNGGNVDALLSSMRTKIDQIRQAG